MARGRMINRRAATSKKLAAVMKADEGAGLLYTLLLAFTDRDGRVTGDVELVKAMVYPRWEEMPKGRIFRRLQLLHDTGLVVWYEVEDDYFIQYNKFRDNQEGMRYEKEKASEIPPISVLIPPIDGSGRKGSDHVRKVSGEVEVEVEVEEKEKNKKETTPLSPSRGKSREALNFDFIENEEWRKLYKEWALNKKNPFRKQIGLKKGFSNLQNLSDKSLIKARQIVDRSLANNWAGLFLTNDMRDEANAQAEGKKIKEFLDAI